ncbi:MAG: hypothetical protein K2H60_14345 [Muribaculaceae bacterium]|nr:hypothetical protein [Muribaculaceae bacterium]
MEKHKKSYSLIDDYLSVLGVPHTSDFSNSRFKEMPFPTLFGFSKLLQEYGVKSEGYLLKDKQEISQLTPPFLAKTPGGLIIVINVSGNSVTYLTEGEVETMPINDFFNVWTGNVLLSFPDANASEPHYIAHSRIDFFMHAKKWVLLICCILLFAYLFITGGLWTHLSTIFITLIDLAGLMFTYMLVQKSVHIHTAVADRVCGVLQEGGCDSILEMKASKFFGIFGWSEVGFSYFSVSLLALLLNPELLPTLALINICCLPFTAWSIWYQKFRAHKWCTLCVCVQASLWLLFFSYLFGGWVRMAWPPTIDFILLGMTYLVVMLGLNAVMPLIEKRES